MTPSRSALLVDDDAHILEVLEMRLSAMGFAVTATQDPEEALAALGTRGFDVALVDLRMEPMDGIAFTRAAHGLQARLPVLIMTAHGTIENAVQAVKEGAFDFLTKPFVTEELRSKLARALSERRWARDRNLLRTVGETLTSGPIDRVLHVVAEGTMETTETERAVVFLREDGRLVPKATAGASATPLDWLAGAAEAAMARNESTTVTGADGRLTLAAPLLVRGTAEGAVVVENPSYVIATGEDVDLLRLFAAQAAVALNNARELSRLRSGALAALGRVASQVAHELNNPLGGLALYARVLEERFAKAGDEEGVQLTRKVERAVKHLGELVTDITAYGRPPELKREEIPANALIEECLSLVQDRVADKQIRVVSNLDAAVGSMLADARELKKVYLNLLVNALDAMEPHGTLTVRSRSAGENGLEVSVEDTGCGMDAETRARMFDLFFTTKANGTGLGMAIARSVVDRHGGRLAVDSEPGRGTRIRIELPLRGTP
ncbi:MAG: response regulator [Deltaproteobacteria bacterium]|nr:MAG: response regulator [Deltaproteobacteria bacterium]